jgi:hypothetical protein
MTVPLFGYVKEKKYQYITKMINDDFITVQHFFKKWKKRISESS